MAELEEKKKSILIVEDDLFLSGMLGQKFTELNFTLFNTADGKKALEIANDNDLDVILLDLLLPDINGFEILEKLKSNEKTRGVPVIILSNLDQSEDIEKAKKMGADKFLVKSTVTLDEIFDEIKPFLI